MIDTESDPGSWADAIAHSRCLRVETFGEIKAALAAVEAGHAERICAPGQ